MKIPSAKPLGKMEFTSLMALMMSLVALSIDAILPALTQIGQDFQLKDVNDAQMMVGVLFFGLGFGQLLYGPLSDSLGRRRSILIGMFIFLLGCLLSLLSDSFYVILLGRALQGFGAASARIVTIALIRDKYVGEQMAKVMSLIMTVFIVVPALAPFLGKVVMDLSHWRNIFLMLFVFGFAGLLWFFLRQEETLNSKNRKDFRFSTLVHGAKEVVSTANTTYYIFAAGCIYGAFVGYLNSVQQVFASVFGIVEDFPLYFAFLALAIGSASLLNSYLVSRYGMRNLVGRALLGIICFSSLYLGFMLVVDAAQVQIFMLYMSCMFFCIGILFGNFNALAMEPLGHIAGIGSAIVASLQTLISVPLGVFIGQSFNDSTYPMVIGFIILASMAALSMGLVNSRLKSTQ